MSKFLIGMFIKFGKSESLRKAALSLLKASKMKVTKFLNIDIEPAPPELELQIEMQCREIMQSNDLDNIKRYCTHMVRKKFDQDIFMASLLNRLIEMESERVIREMRKEKIKSTNPIKKFFRIG